jgi:ATP-dependent DNA ligase
VASRPVSLGSDSRESVTGYRELKYDAFRALAYVDGGGSKLVSRRNLVYRRFKDLASHLSLEVNAYDAVLDGEIVKLDNSGRPFSWI